MSKKRAAEVEAATAASESSRARSSPKGKFKVPRKMGLVSPEGVKSFFNIGKPSVPVVEVADSPSSNDEKPLSESLKLALDDLLPAGVLLGDGCASHARSDASTAMPPREATDAAACLETASVTTATTAEIPSPEAIIGAQQNFAATDVSSSLGTSGDERKVAREMYIREQMQLVSESDIVEKVQGKVGSKLTEGNLKEWDSHFSKLAEGSADEKAARQNVFEGLSEYEKRKYKALKAAHDSGKLEPTSYLMADFRKAHQRGTEAGDAYYAMSRDAAARHRAEWASLELDTFKHEKIYKKSWRRVDFTKGRYKTLGKVIHDDGGFEDRSAVEGGVTLAQQCSLMGAPWVKWNFQKRKIMLVAASWQRKGGGAGQPSQS